MASVFELLGDAPADQSPAPVDTPGQFRQGFRSGLSGAYSQLQGLGGAVAESVGLDGVAQRAYGGMRESQAQAEADAPRVTSYKDVHDLRSGFDYVTGVLGQSVPQSAAAVGGALMGRTPAGRVLGATAASVPFEAGDVVQRQQNNPASLEASAQDRLLHAVGGGTASAAAQSIVPAAVAGKLRGPVSGGVGETVKRGLREAPAAMMIEGTGEATGEAFKQAALMQSDPSAQFDPEALKEGFVGGAVAGGALHGVGVAGETARAAVQAPGNTLLDVVKGAKGMLPSAGPAEVATPAPAGAAPAAEAPKVDLPDPVEAVRSIYDQGVAKGRAFWDRVAAREDVADLKSVAGKTAEQIKGSLPTMDGERVRKVQEAANELMASAGLDEGRRAQLQAAAADLTDRGNQAVVATLKKGADATRAFAASAQSLVDEFKAKAKPAAEGGAKKSEDFSGVREAIARELVPALKKVNPDIFEDSQAIGQAAEGVRLAIDAFKSGGKEALTSSQIARLIDTFGDQTVNVLDSVNRAIGQVSPQESESFYSALNEIRARQKDQDKTLGLMMRSVTPELQDSVTTSDVRRELAALRRAVNEIDTSTAQGKFQWETLRFDLDTRYGNNADKVLAAIEKEAKAKDNVLAKEDITEMTEADASALGDAIYYGPEKGGLAMHPDLDPAGDKSQARQAMARAAKQNPDRTVRFLTARELGMEHPDVQVKLKELQQAFIEAGKDIEEAVRLAKEAVQQYGMAAAEGKSEPGTITKENVKVVRVKEEEGKTKSSHYRQPSVFKVDNAAYDAIALTKMIERQFKGERNESDNKGAVHRNARMFMIGVGALQDYLGKAFDIPDTLVIDHLGTTVADVKKLGFMPPNRAADALDKKLQELRKAYVKARNDADRQAIRLQAQNAIDAVKVFDPRMDIPDVAQEGQPDTDPFGNVYAALKMRDEDPKVQAEFEKQKERGKGDTPGGALPKDEETAAKSGPVKGTGDVLREKFEAWVKNPPSAAAKAVGEKGLALIDNKDKLNASAKKALAALLSKGKKPSDVAATVNALYEKFSGKFDAPAAEAAKPTSKFDAKEIDRIVDREDWDEVGETKEQVDDFLVSAARRMLELRGMSERTDEQDVAYLKLRNLLVAGNHNTDLGSFYDDIARVTDEQARQMIAQAVPEVAASVVPKASLQGTGTQRISGQDLKDIRAYVDRVLGPQVKTALAKIPHAGEYVNDTIRVSVHALSPMTVAYHEALHAFFAKLSGQGNGDVARVLERSAMSAPIQNQLRKLLAGESAALSQLRDPEEAAAYMYQFWAAGQLKVGGATGNLFERIKEAIAKVIGVLTNDQRAETIMEYFHSGEFKSKGLGQPNAVARALMETGRNKALDKVGDLTKPLVDVADSLAAAGGQRLRDTGVPALRELADIMKVTGRDTADDLGFMPAWRRERTRIMNDFGTKMFGYTQAQIEDALAAMQSGAGPASAKTAEGRLAAREIQKLLADMLKYMRDAGVDVNKIIPNANYFPRVYDAHYISKHRTQFEAVLIKHGVNVREAEAITMKLMATDGQEITIETDKPGMQHMKHRSLGFIPDAELAPYMRKNLFDIMSSYVTQATRRAEWARRLGDDGQGVTRLLDRAKRQGATADQLETARKYIRAIDGTLGDDISPTARRIMGNVVVYQNIRLLPLAVFSSVVDPLGIVVRGGTVGDAWSAFKRAIKEIPSAYKREFKADADTELAATLGVIDHALLASTVGQLYTQGMVGDTARKYNDTFFRWNLMEGFNRSMRVGATQAAIRFLERHRDGKASDHSVRWLAELGLQPGFKMDLADPKVRAAINMWVDGAVLRPDATDKPIWMSDPHWMLVAHLKQFIFAFQETILKRVAHEARQGNYAPAMAISAYVPAMIASDLIKGMIQGGGELPEWKKDWGPGDYLSAGVQRAGLLGKGQFVVDGPGMLLGPTAQQVLGLKDVLEGRGEAGRALLKALPANPLYAGWGGADTVVEPTTK